MAAVRKFERAAESTCSGTTRLCRASAAEEGSYILQDVPSSRDETMAWGAATCTRRP